MDKVNLIEFDLNTSEIVKDIQSIKTNIEALKTAQQNALESSGELSAEYIQATANLRAEQDALKTTENLHKKLTAAQNEQAGAVKKLEAENAKLRLEQSKLKLDTVESIKRNEEINNKINQNTEIIKANVDQRKKELMNIGNYPGAFGKMKEAITSNVPALNNLSGAVKTFLANPLITIIAGIAAAAITLYKAFSRSEESMNKVKQVGGALSGIFNGLLKILQPLANFIADKLIATFETLGNIAEKTLGLVSKGLVALGFDNAAKSVNNFTSSMKEAAKVGMELAKMEGELQKAQRESEKIQLDYQKRAEKLRQLRDDESKTIPERIKANEELGKVLKEQLNAELSIAQRALDVANKRIQLEGDTTENLNKRAEALTKISDIQERLTGQESEQLANLNSLRKEANSIRLAAEKERADKELKLEEERVNEIVKDFERELAAYKLLNKSKLENGKPLTEESVAQEQARLEALRQKEIEFAMVSISDNEEYMLRELEINTEFEEQKKVLKEEYYQQQRDFKAEALEADFNNEMAALEENLFAQSRLQKDYLKRQQAEELRVATITGANKDLINKKYAQAEIAIDRAVLMAKLNSLSSLAGNISKLFGEGTNMGKAAATAQVAIDTYQAAFAAYKSTVGIPYVGPFLAPVAAGVAAGLGAKAIKDIWAVKVDIPKSTIPGTETMVASGGGGGQSISTSYSGGGSAQTFEAVRASVNPEIGQGIVSRNQTNQSDIVASGVEQGMARVNLQPTLVIDDVTNKQTQSNLNKQTQVL